LLATQGLTGGIGAESTSNVNDTNIQLQFRISEQAFGAGNTGVTLNVTEDIANGGNYTNWSDKAKNYINQKLFTIRGNTLQSFNTLDFIKATSFIENVSMPPDGGGGLGAGSAMGQSALPGIFHLVEGGTLFNQLKSTDWTNPQSSQLFDKTDAKYKKRISEEDGSPNKDFAPYFIQTLYGASYAQFIDDDGITRTMFFSGGYISLFDLKQFIIAGSLRGLTASMDPSSYQVGRWELGATGTENAWFRYGDSYNRRNTTTPGKYNLFLGSGFNQKNPTTNSNNPVGNVLIGYDNLPAYDASTYNIITGSTNLTDGFNINRTFIFGHENLTSGTTKTNNVVIVGYGNTGSSQITNSIYIGNYNKGQGTTNEIIIGNSLTGKGNNTTIIGGNVFFPDGITGTTLTNSSLINPSISGSVTVSDSVIIDGGIF